MTGRPTNLAVVGIAAENMLTPDEATEWIVESYRTSVESIIETGRRLAEAKARVPHGSWGRVIDGLPFNERTAQKLMTIAAHPALANPSHGTVLPSAWTALYPLAQVPAEEFDDLVARGVIHADLTRAEAQQIADQFSAARQAALEAWTGCVDQITGALGYFNGGQTPPADMPANHTPPAEALARARALVNYLERITQ